MRYLMDYQASDKRWSWHEIFIQIIISGFTGFLGGLYGHEKDFSLFMTLVFAGLSGSLGGHLLELLWKKILNSQIKKP